MEELIKFTHLAKVMEEFIIKVRGEYQDNLIKNDHLASGTLLNSIEYTTSFNGNDYVVRLQLEDYWKYVEYDTKPHFPPVDALLKWISIKPVLPHPDKNGKLPTPKQLAYLIGREIDENGTKGTSDLENATDEIMKEFETKIAEAIDADLGDSVDAAIRVLYKG